MSLFLGMVKCYGFTNNPIKYAVICSRVNTQGRWSIQREKAEHRLDYCQSNIEIDRLQVAEKM